MSTTASRGARNPRRSQRRRNQSQSSLNRNQGAQRDGLKVLGFALGGVGAMFAIVGIRSFFDGSADNFWCAFVGLPMLGLAGLLLKFAYLGTIARYVAGEAAPVASDTLRYLGRHQNRSTVRHLATEFAAGSRRDRRRAVPGTASALAAAAAPESTCTDCHYDNDADASFCAQCGGALAAPACSSCKRALRSNDRFCSGCGTAVAGTQEAS